MAEHDYAAKNGRNYFGPVNAGDVLNIKFNTGDATSAHGSIGAFAGGPNLDMKATVLDPDGSVVGGPVGPSATVKIDFTLKPQTVYTFRVQLGTFNETGVSLTVDYVQPMDRPGHGVAHHGWLNGLWHNVRGR